MRCGLTPLQTLHSFWLYCIANATCVVTLLHCKRYMRCDLTPLQTLYALWPYCIANAACVVTLLHCKRYMHCDLTPLQTLHELCPYSVANATCIVTLHRCKRYMSCNLTPLQMVHALWPVIILQTLHCSKRPYPIAKVACVVHADFTLLLKRTFLFDILHVLLMITLSYFKHFIYGNLTLF